MGSHNLWLEEYAKSHPFDEEAYQARKNELSKSAGRDKKKLQSSPESHTKKELNLSAPDGSEVILTSNMCSVHNTTHRFDEKSLKVSDCGSKLLLNKIEFLDQRLWNVIKQKQYRGTGTYRILRNSKTSQKKSMGLYFSRYYASLKHDTDLLTTDILANKKRAPRPLNRIIRGMFYFLGICYPEYLNNTDYIVPVPNYNHENTTAESIATSLSDFITENYDKQITCLSALERTFTTKLHRIWGDAKKAEFFVNNPNAYVVSDDVDIQGKNLLLVDDITTTGLTIEICKKKLERKGANVFMLTSCRTWHGGPTKWD